MRASSGSHGIAVMEQIEIDWRFATALEAADNELLARTLIAQAFRAEGLEVTFLAKPIEGVAGSGEHTHVGIAARLKDGSIRTCSPPPTPQQDYLSPIGWGALMGLLRHWEVVSPFVTCSTDAFNRLKPGFEAPVCIVAAVGHTVEEPSRNRSVLAGLVRDKDNPLATRFEVRAPNPHTNSFLALAAMYQAMLDGIAHARLLAAARRRSSQAEFSKQPGERGRYLEPRPRLPQRGRCLRALHAGGARPPLRQAARDGRRDAARGSSRTRTAARCCSQDGVFDERLIASYRDGDAQPLAARADASGCCRPTRRSCASAAACTRTRGAGRGREWEEVQALRTRLLQGGVDSFPLFQRIREAVERQDDAQVSALQLEMSALMSELRRRYAAYERVVLNPLRAIRSLAQACRPLRIAMQCLADKLRGTPTCPSSCPAIRYGCKSRSKKAIKNACRHSKGL